jgi:hypothetical protein
VVTFYLECSGCAKDFVETVGDSPIDRVIHLGRSWELLCPQCRVMRRRKRHRWLENFVESPEDREGSKPQNEVLKRQQL